LEPAGVTMPRWPAYVMLAAAAACAYPAVTNEPMAQESYRALGQEPGWNLTIANRRIDYVGDYGETKISVPAPEPITAINGHIYQAGRLQVHISHGRCNDTMSGHGYADTVMVIADGKTVNGCGGTRRSDWDQ
jgi:heat shock protein HslJ